MAAKRKKKSGLKSLHTDPSPKLLDEILPNMNISTLRRWFDENLIGTKSGKEIAIIDKRQRRIRIRKNRLNHLIHTDDKKGGTQKYYPMKAKCLNLIRRCLEDPLEMRVDPGGSVIYISRWKIIKRTRYVVFCRINGNSWELKTHMHIDDETLEGWRKRYRYDWDII